MGWTLKRPRKGRKYYTVEIRLPGVKRELSTQCTRRSDAVHVARRLHAQHAAAETRVPLLVAIETLIGLRTRMKRSKATIEITEDKGAQLCRVLGSDTDVGALTLRETTGYVVKRREDGVTDSTIAKEMGTLRAALRYLGKLGLYDRNPDHLWPPELPHGSGVRDRWLTWDEYLKVLQAIRPEWRDALVVYTQCGLSYSELYRLTAECIGELLHVPGTKTETRDRYVPMTPDVLEVLERRAEAHPSGPLWPFKRSKASQKDRWSKALSRACERAGVDHASTNDLRRTFASWAFQRGVPEPILIKWMGHKTSTMVRTVYARPSAEQHQSEVAKMPSRRSSRTN
jgi:integrase